MSPLPKCTVFFNVAAEEIKIWFWCCLQCLKVIKIKVWCFLSDEEFKPHPSPCRMFLFAQRFEVFCDLAIQSPVSLTATSLQPTPKDLCCFEEKMFGSQFPRLGFTVSNSSEECTSAVPYIYYPCSNLVQLQTNNLLESEYIRLKCSPRFLFFRSGYDPWKLCVSSSWNINDRADFDRPKVRSRLTPKAFLNFG